MKFTIQITIIFLLVISAFPAEAKTQKVRKTQEVNFSEMNMKGTIRNPDGAYLLQKKGMKFQPLYKIQEEFDRKLREPALYTQ